MIERHVVADFSGFADDDAGAMIDEKAPADGRTGMNIDIGQASARTRIEAAPMKRQPLIHSRWAMRCQITACTPG